MTQRTTPPLFNSAGFFIMKLFLREWKVFLGEAKRNDWDSAHVVLIKGDKVLLVQRAEGDHWMPGKWATPGGEIDKGETLESALKREIQEEVGLTVELEDLFYLPETSYKLKHAFFVCKKSSGKYELNANGVHEHDDGRWVTKQEISKLDTVPDVKTIVDEAFKLVKEL